MIGPAPTTSATPPPSGATPVSVVASGINWRAVGRFVVIALALAFALYVLTLIPKTVGVFLVAMLIAYGLNPVVRRLQRRMPRAVAIAVIYLVLTLVAAVLLIIIVPRTLEQFQVVLANAPAYIADARNFVDGIQTWLDAHLRHVIATNQIQTIEATSIGQISSSVDRAIGSASAIAVGVANAIVILVFGVILSYFFLANSDAIRDSYYSLFPERAQPQARRFATEVDRIVGGFIVGQAVLCVLTFAITYVGLLIIRSPFALLLAVIAGVLYAVPYIGVVLAALLGFLLGALSSWKTGVLVALIIALASRVSDFLVPKVMGESVGVSPMAIVVAVFAGAELFGFWGLVLAIPAAAVLKVIWILWLHPWLTGKQLTIDDGAIQKT